LDAGVLRLLVLLAGLARRAPWPTGTARPAGRHGGRAGAEATGIGAEPAVSSSWPVALRAVRAWLIPWSVLALLAVVVTSTAAPAAATAA
jgi:hypothetical protein